MVDVSVIICTRNRAAYIKNALESVLAQTFSNIELIIINDGSTDNTDEIIRPYADRDPRIRYVQQQNIGIPRTRNKALEIARGKYIAFLDDDDMWLSEKLATQVNFMEAHPEVGLCYSRFQIYKKEGNHFKKGKLFPETLATTFEETLDVFIPPPSALIRKSCLDEVGWFDPKYHFGSDFDLCLRFAHRWPIAPIDQVLAVSIMDGRVHGPNSELTALKNEIQILKNLKLLSSYKDHKELIKFHIAKRYYYLGHEYLDQDNYRQATWHFLRALFTDPLIRFSFHRSGECGFELFAAVIRSYLVIPVCFLKGLIHGRR